jgi:hypothetical protein
MPADATEFDMHLTTRKSGTIQYDGLLFCEATELEPGNVETLPMEKEQLVLWQVPSIVKVFQETLPPHAIGPLSLNGMARQVNPHVMEIQAPFRVQLAQEEEEALQIAVRSGSDGDLEFHVEGLEGSGIHLSCGNLGYVPVHGVSDYYHRYEEAWIQLTPSKGNGGNDNTGSDGWEGLWPDPICPVNTLRLPANSTRALWLSFRTDGQTRPGRYPLWLHVTHNGVTTSLPIQLKVWNFALPQDTTFPAIYDLRTQSQWLKGREPKADYLELMRFMKEKKLCPDKVPVAPVFSRNDDGTITADFSEYNRMATLYFDELKFPSSYTPGIFYAFGWGYPPKSILGEQPFDGESPWSKGEPRTRLRPEYVSVYQTCLKLFMDNARAHGWDGKYTLYISDEPATHLREIREQMIALCDMIRNVEPHLPIYSSTWAHHPFWDGHLSHWGLAHYGLVPSKVMKERQAAGDKIWFTTDGQLCLDTPYCAIERLLPHYCSKYNVDAYEFWGANWLTYDPWKYGWHAYIRQTGSPTEPIFWVRYPDGDGYIMYPGTPFGQITPITSIRMEAARDGVEDFELLALLKAQAQTSHEAAALLVRIQSLVSIPNSGGRYSTRILPQPERLYQLRHEIGEFLDQIGK